MSYGIRCGWSDVNDAGDWLVALSFGRIMFHRSTEFFTCPKICNTNKLSSSFAYLLTFLSCNVTFLVNCLLSLRVIFLRFMALKNLEKTGFMIFSRRER